MNDPIQLVYVTTPDRETATSLATLAVEQGLAACGNVGGPITSVFRWEGAVQTGEEWTLLLKTSAAQLEALTGLLSEAHPYTVPCIVAVDSSGGLPAFHDWVRSACATGGSS